MYMRHLYLHHISLSLSLSFTLSLREGKFALKNRCGPVVDLATATTPATTPAKATKKNLNFGVEAILEFQIRFMSPAGCVRAGFLNWFKSVFKFVLDGRLAT